MSERDIVSLDKIETDFFLKAALTYSDAHETGRLKRKSNRPDIVAVNLDFNHHMTIWQLHSYITPMIFE